MFEKYGVQPPDLAKWTIPQTLAVLTEPKDNLKSGEVECGSMQEAIEVSRKIKAAEAAQDAPD